MGTHIDYPTQTSGWGKALIDTLNTVVQKLETQVASVSSKLATVSSEIVTVNVTLNTFREEALNKVDEIKTVATSALTLAKENQECTKSIRDEMTNHKLSYDKSLQDIKSEIDTIKQSNKTICDENNYLRFTCEQLASKNKVLAQHTNNLENYTLKSTKIIMYSLTMFPYALPLQVRSCTTKSTNLPVTKTPMNFQDPLFTHRDEVNL